MFSRDPVFLHRARTRRAAATVGAAVVLAAAAVACSSSDDTSPPASNGGSQPGTTAVQVSQMTDEQRVAEAKTQAVGYFEALATLDYDKASERSSGSASVVVDWTKAANGIEAAKGTPYETKAVNAPNVRVQFDKVTESGDSWTASGFVELGYRPGRVTAPSSTVAPTTAPSGSVVPNPNVFVTDFVFSDAGDHLKVQDYRLDDTPYPVSQLFIEGGAADARATGDGVEGTLTYAHRDFDGSVQYLVDVRNSGSSEMQPSGAAFEPKEGGAAKRVRATLFADEIAAGASADVLIVLPGAFPGAEGTAILEVPRPATSSGSTVPGTTAGSSQELRMTVPPWPTLTPRPVNAVKDSQSATGTTTTTTSTPGGSTTTTTAASGGGAPTIAPTTAPSGPTTTTTAPTTTSTSTTTTTKV
jgi:hypothetical protein